MIRKFASVAAATLLGVAVAVVALDAPAFAEPHASAANCPPPPGGGSFSGYVGWPYSQGPNAGGDGEKLFGDTPVYLLTDKTNGAASAWADLQGGDYLSIDHTNSPVDIGVAHYGLLTTAELANPNYAQPPLRSTLGANFTWEYCEVRNNASTIQRVFTPTIAAEGHGVRVCITRPSVSPYARCVNGQSGVNRGGWYVDNNDGGGHPVVIPPGGGDEPDPGSATGSTQIVTFQANTGFLYTRDANGTMHDTRYGMMRGTSPATSNGQVAFQANTGSLFTRSVNGSMHDTGYGMMAGTSPAISGGQIAFQANNTLLHTRNMNTGQTTDLRLGMMAGSSPSIAGNTSSWRIAFQANDGFLYYRDSGGATVNTGYGMMRGTSPAITKLSNGTYVTAFQANNSLLYSYINGTATDLRLGLMTDTSPSIASSGTAWTIAFQANTGSLFTRNSAGATADTGWGMMAHTSPSSRGNRITFQANTGFLYYRDGNAMAVDTRYGMMAGTSPGA